MTTTTPRALYVHVPFCHTICGYCDFYSEVYDKQAVGPLVDALLSELDQYRPALRGGVETIFVGGGTPTTLPPDQLARLLDALHALADPTVPLEFTVEANPATVTPKTAEVLAACGVNRVSIGAQSFDRAELAVLDRIHSPPQVGQTIQICRAAGISQLNIDLIFAVPGQTLAAWLQNLQAALELRPDHLSCYGLTYEDGTPLTQRLRAGQVRRVDADVEAAMYEATIDTLASVGFAQYEISNFARAGRQCRHNLVYWHNEPYVGIGPSAAGFVDGVRYKNVPDTAAYARGVKAGRRPRIEEEPTTPDRQARETMMLGLRLNEGVSRTRFVERFRVDVVEYFGEALRKHEELGLLDVRDDAVRLTRRGLLVADSVLADFV